MRNRPIKGYEGDLIIVDEAKFIPIEVLETVYPLQTEKGNVKGKDKRND